MPEVEVDEFEEILALENLDLYEWLSAQVGNRKVVSGSDSRYQFSVGSP